MANYAYLDKVGVLHITHEKSVDVPEREYLETEIECEGGYPLVSVVKGGEVKRGLYMDEPERAKLGETYIKGVELKGRYPEVVALYNELLKKA